MASPTNDRLLHYQQWRSQLEDPFVELDLSCSGMTDEDLGRLQQPLEQALAAMQDLEGGAISNPDEGRMVGHYWLRAPGLAPAPEIGEEIVEALRRIERFVQDVHDGRIAPPGAAAGQRTFRKVLLCGIGGSALGPMLLGAVFGGLPSPVHLTVLDNTDPDGIDRALLRQGTLADALVIVISKSGGTPETRNCMLETQAQFRAQGLEFARQAVAITMPGSKLDKIAEEEGWLLRLPMWDWVGGRTSIMSAVGLLPGALIGMDVRALLAGAAAMDDQCRKHELRDNPAAMLAAFWHCEGHGRGQRAMAVLPYKDRLLLLSRYLQQLVMESLGKELDRSGQAVNQGLTVYGNKGSTDQHAYVQQLREGLHDFFAVFVRVLEDRRHRSVEVEEGVTTGDYLDGFWRGTQQALLENGRHSATLCVNRLDERTMGAMIALFERTVSIYAELINVNAYHQPGVEAGKRAAAKVLDLQRSLVQALGGQGESVRDLAARVGADAADCWSILCHLAANGRILRVGEPDPDLARFSAVGVSELD